MKKYLEQIAAVCILLAAVCFVAANRPVAAESANSATPAAGQTAQMERLQLLDESVTRIHHLERSQQLASIA